MKNKYHTVRTVPKSNNKIVETESKSGLLIHILNFTGTTPPNWIYILIVLHSSIKGILYDIIEFGWKGFIDSSMFLY
jgi:hypothetical protein